MTLSPLPLALFDPLIERFHDPCVNRGDDINRGIEFLLCHPCFPCVRKASFRSGLAVPGHGYGQTEEHLFSIAQAGHAVCLAVKGAEIGSVHDSRLLLNS